jgi:hypothetical protein
MRQPRSGLAIAGVIALFAVGACSIGTATVAPSVGEPATSVTPSAATSAPASPATSIEVDAGLLRVLPQDVGGVAIVESPEGEADASGTASLRELADAVAAGVAVDKVSGDFVYAVVVALRPGFDAATFRAWRDSYDAGACPKGDVPGHAEAEIGGRTVSISTCANGVRTYHAWIQESEVLVSASSTGDRRFGEVLMNGLRP